MHPRRGPGRPRRHCSRGVLQSRRTVTPVRATKSEQRNAKLSDRVEEVRILCREISSAVSNLEKWMSAVYNISRATRDRKTLDDLISAISKIETRDKQEELKELPTVTADNNNPPDFDTIMKNVDTLLEKLTGK